MSDTGYTTRPVGSLSIADLLEEALQAADSAGHYAATDQAYSFWHNEAIQRRDQCFEELKRRLEAAEALAEALKTFTRHPYLFGGTDDYWYCKFCNNETKDSLYQIAHADTCPIGQGLAALGQEASDG